MKRETQTEKQNQQEDQEELRRGPWTLEEDTLLIHYVACHGEGRWNLLAKSAGLKRTGKSCRLRWLNYLKPDIKRGNLSPQEQLLILELHSKWGNRWSKIAAHLPGRTDNEIKNYWRTRVQKQARQLNMESNSQSFIDAIRCFYMPRLVEKIEQNSNDSTTMNMDDEVTGGASQSHNIIEVSSSSTNLEHINFANKKDTSSTNNSLSNSVQEFQDHSTSKGSCLQLGENNHNCTCDMDLGTMSMSMSMSASDFPFSGGHVDGNNWLGCDMAGDGMWDLDELWQFRK